MGQSGPMMRGVHVEPLNLDRSLSQVNRRCRIESQLYVRDQSLVGFGDPRLATWLANLGELQGLCVVRCAMELHVLGAIRLCERSAKGSFGEHRKRQRVIVLRSPNSNRRQHRATSLSRCEPRYPPPGIASVFGKPT